MIRREGKPKRIETFADLIQHVQKIDLENTDAFVLEDAKGNRYRFVKKRDEATTETATTAQNDNNRNHRRE